MVGINKDDCALGQQCLNGICSAVKSDSVDEDNVMSLFEKREDQRQREIGEREDGLQSRFRKGRINSYELQRQVDQVRRRAVLGANEQQKRLAEGKAPEDKDEKIIPPAIDTEPPADDKVPPAKDTEPPAEVEPPSQPPPTVTLEAGWYIFEVTATWLSPYNGEDCHWTFYNQNHGPAKEIPSYQNKLEEMLRSQVEDKPYVDMTSLKITSEVYAGPSETRMEKPSGSTYWPLGVKQ